MEFKLEFSFGKKKKPKADEKAPVITSVIESSSDQISDAKVVSEQDMTDDEYDKKFGPMIRKAFEDFSSGIKRSDQGAMIGNDEAVDTNSQKPVLSPGRSSVYEGYRSFLPNSNGAVPTDFDFRMLKFLQQMAIWNQHISYAVDNLVTMGNTEYEVNFGPAIRDADARRMRMHLSQVMPNWYDFSSGENSLDNDLLGQLATAGCISAEGTIKQNLDGIRKVVIVNPYYVRFAYDQQRDDHIPLQQLGSITDSRARGKYPGYIELNTNTYSYMAMRRFSELPYAIPPFLSAIESIMVENDMIKNLRNVMRRMGMLGFMSVLLTAPKAVGNMTPEGYYNYLMNYLEKVKPEIESGFDRGVAIGFKGTHEFEMQGQNLNAVGAEHLMKIVKSLIFSGLKQDPNMHGENYSVTETFGRVILTKMTQQVVNYQLSLGAFKSKLIMLELLMNGFRPDMVECVYKKPAVGDQVKDQEARKGEIENADALYRQGIISHSTKSKMLGYDVPDLPGYRILDIPPGITLIDPSTPVGEPVEGGEPADPAKPAPQKKK